jgi:AraC family transcriptional regulator, exoenzyme S synthesis regulatory protein ExsA
MSIEPIELPDYYGGETGSEFYFHHFVTEEKHVRHNIVLKQNLICIILQGSKEVFGSHRPMKVGNHQVLLMSSGSSIMMHSVANGGEKLESILIFFSDRVLQDLCVKHKLHLSGKKEKSSSVMTVDKDEFLKNFECSVRLLNKKEFNQLQKLKLEEILLYLAIKKPSEAFSSFLQNALGDQRSEKLRHVVAANCANGLSVEELAFLCDMSVSTFKRHFLKTFGCPPKKFLIDKKMEKAQELLRIHQHPSEIFRDLRYQSLSAFSVEFKKYHGVSPKEFQRNLVCL